MKFTTFIKAYKLVLSDIEKKVRDWNRVFITKVSFDDEKLKMVFANNKDMSPGTIAMQTAVNYFTIENCIANALLDKLSISDAYADVVDEINDVGKFLSIMDFVLSQLVNMVKDVDNDVQLLDLYADTDNNLVIIDLALTEDNETFKMTLRTDGKITMFSEYSED